MVVSINSGRIRKKVADFVYEKLVIYCYALFSYKCIYLLISLFSNISSVSKESVIIFFYNLSQRVFGQSKKHSVIPMVY